MADLFNLSGSGGGVSSVGQTYRPPEGGYLAAARRDYPVGNGWRSPASGLNVALNPSGTGAIRNLLSGSGLFGGEDKPKPWAKLPGGRNTWRGLKLLDSYNQLLPGTLDITAAGAAGFGDIYRQESEKTRADELASFQKYGPAYVKAITEADPDQAELRRLINELVAGELKSGGDLSPAQMRLSQQGTRQAQAARGMGYGKGDSLQEVLDSLDYSRGLKNERIGNALQVGNFNQRVIGDPFMAFAGRPSQPQGSNIQSPGYSNFNNDLASFMANDELMSFNAHQNSLNRSNALIGAGISAVGSLAGGAAAFCWVARAVYGEDNPMWLRFRQWMLDHAPRDLFDLYVKVGPKLAARLEHLPKLKAKLRAWMDEKLAVLPSPLSPLTS